MRAYLATNVMGSFAFDRKGKLLEKVLFQKKPEEIAERLDSKDFVSEEKELLSILVSLGYKEVVTDKDAQFKGLIIVAEDENLGKQTLKEEFRSYAIQFKWVSSQAELNELLSKVNVSRTKEKLRVERRDLLLMRAVGVMDELDKDINSFSERLREWYGVHFPELSREVQSHERFADIVSVSGMRENVKEFAELAKASSGMEVSEVDMKEIQGLASTILEMVRRRKAVEAYIEAAGKEIIPNTSAVAGAALASKLLVLAGGLEKLSRMPSSTIQVLGAEKALFRHLKGEGKAPKYGILFSHPLVQNAVQEKRGKVARLVAAKLFLATKKDFFSKGDAGETLRKELEQQAARV